MALTAGSHDVSLKRSVSRAPALRHRSSTWSSDLAVATGVDQDDVDDETKCKQGRSADTSVGVLQCSYNDTDRLSVYLF